MPQAGVAFDNVRISHFWQTWLDQEVIMPFKVELFLVCWSLIDFPAFHNDLAREAFEVVFFGFADQESVCFHGWDCVKNYF